MQAAINALFSPNIIGTSYDFVDRFWDFDKHYFGVVWVCPRGRIRPSPRYRMAIAMP
jgi:hypothetical protein